MNYFIESYKVLQVFGSKKSLPKGKISYLKTHIW